MENLVIMKLNRININSNSPWEPKVGYSRAVKVGNQIFVSGTTATNNEGEIIGKNDPYKQTVQCIKNIEAALQNVGSSLIDVVRVRIYVINIEDWEIIGKAFYDFFAEIKPAATMVEVTKLITPEALVEIEADIIVS